MIVDDSLIIRKRLINILLEVSNTLEILQAENAEFALSKFKSEKPEIVILDIALPDMSGILVLKAMKRIFPETKILMLTNFPTEQFKEACLKLGADYFLSKSDEFEKIPKIISSLLKECK
jgi:DNA-binding NarL/FixJ family response regulator